MKNRTLYITLFFFLNYFSSQSQSYFGTGDTIPDDGTSIDFPIYVSGLPSSIDTINFGLESVCLDIIHTWDADLQVSLVAPDGTSVLLFTGVGYDGDNFTNTCLRSDASSSIVSNWAPFTGDFRPMGSLGKVNNGQNPNGIWILRVYDTYAWADWGVHNNWSITFGNNPATVFSFYSSDIPIVVINTSGQQIVDDPKITAHMGIIDNGYGIRNYLTDNCNSYNGWIGIELRGSSSQMFPKKSYGLETRDASGNDSNAVLLGMPSESDWCLLANYSDKTMMRNCLAYNFSSFLGHYAPRTRYCEFVLNDEYQGVYMFTEKIKKDSNRVDIAKLDSNEISGDDLTGGYIFKIDKQTGSGGDGWVSNYPPMSTTQGQSIFFQYEYPKAADIVQQQKDYILAYVDSFETALNSVYFADTSIGYKKYIGVNSFIDYFIINEISKNVDGYRLSTFLHKDKESNGGKLHIGPAWDFDLAWWNADYCSGYDFTGWAYKFGDVCPDDWWQLPNWWHRLMLDTNFTGKLQCRWEYLRNNVLDTTYIFHFIDSVATYINEGQTRNFEMWPILGVYVWPNPSPLATTYDGEIHSLKKWIRNRLAWLDDSIPGNCYVHVGISEYKNENTKLKIYPNPVSANIVYIEIPHASYDKILIEVIDFTGKTVDSFSFNDNMSIFTIIPPSVKGIYLIKVTSGKKIHTGKIIVD
ncbi:MAG: CotH kinase family protein [Bacteroidota bacterium]